jgi:hypothetical protein
MHHWKRILALTGIATVCFLTGFRGSEAQSNIPPLPDQAVLDKVIKDAGLPTHVPLSVPSPLSNQFLAMTIALNPKLSTGDLTPDKIFDLPRAVYYVDVDSGLRRISIPMLNAADTVLSPMLQTPDDNLPGQIIGAVFEPDKGPMLLVIAWKDKSKKPSDIRFYTYSDGKLQYTTPYKLIFRKLKGNKSGKVAPGDQGVAIASRETCFSVGLDQVCYAPDKHTPDDQARSTINEALQELSKAYAFKVKFDLDGALPDVAGSDWRTQCADKLKQATTLSAITKVPECSATMVFTAASQIQAGQPIALFHLSKDIDHNAYDLTGTFVGKVSAGNYLAFDATPNVTEPGEPSVLFLVNADGKNHCLIPSGVIEGFGASDDKDASSRRGQAAIKDANAGFHDF